MRGLMPGAGKTGERMPERASPSFERQSQRRMRLVLVGFLLALYPLAYLRAYADLGPQASSFYLVPLAAAAWLFGWRGGLVVGLLGIPFHLALDAGVGASAPNYLGIATGLMVGVAFGWMRDVRVRLGEQARELARGRQELEEQGWLRSTTEAEARRRVEQQALVADLGARALRGEPREALFLRAVEAAKQGLGTDFADLVEHDPVADRLVIRAIVGAQRDLVGTPLTAGRGSHSGYTLLVGQPVIVEDYTSDPRFHTPLPTRRYRLASGLCVIVGDPMADPFGALSVYTRERRRFSDDDVSFLQSLANVLALALQRPERAAPAPSPDAARRA